MFGESIIAWFGPFGLAGALIALFLIFLLDAMVFPALPELFAVIFFLDDPSFHWGAALLITACLGEVCGNSLLYLIVKHIRVPKFIDKVFNKYVDFLICSDERLVLINRVAPAIPFTGAFIAICNWNYKKAISYVLIGGIFKYTVLFLLVKTYNDIWTPDTARLFTIITIIIMIGLSFIASFIYKKKRIDPIIDQCKEDLEKKELETAEKKSNT